jgi:hypothetical protein
LEPNNLDYRKLATNYDEIARMSPQIYQQMSQLPVDELNNPDSYFWTGQLK